MNGVWRNDGHLDYVCEQKTMGPHEIMKLYKHGDIIFLMLWNISSQSPTTFDIKAPSKLNEVIIKHHTSQRTMLSQWTSFMIQQSQDILVLQFSWLTNFSPSRHLH